MTKSNIATINHGDLPSLPHHSQVYGRAKYLVEYRWLGPKRPGMGRAESRLADLDAILPDVQAGLGELEAIARPALEVEIAKPLLTLIGCFPSGNTDPQMFGRTVIEIVAASHPAIDDVRDGCNHLLRTHKGFCPGIAEILEAIRAAKYSREEVVRQMVEIIDSRDRWVDEVEQEHRQRQEWLEYQKTIWRPGE